MVLELNFMLQQKADIFLKHIAAVTVDNFFTFIARSEAEGG